MQEPWLCQCSEGKISSDSRNGAWAERAEGRSRAWPAGANASGNPAAKAMPSAARIRCDRVVRGAIRAFEGVDSIRERAIGLLVVDRSICFRAMRTAVRAIIVGYCLAVCPVLFSACGGKPAGNPGAAPSAHATKAETAETKKEMGPKTGTEVRHVDAVGAKKLLAETPGIVVLDVRTPGEYAGGHLAGAKNLDFNVPEFRDHLSKLDRNATYLVHCAGGGRSTRSLTRFQELGFKSVVHLDGGFNGWVQAGQPVEK